MVVNGIGINIVAVSRLFVFVLLMFGMVCSHAQGLEPASEPCVIPSPHECDHLGCVNARLSECQLKQRVAKANSATLLQRTIGTCLRESAKQKKRVPDVRSILASQVLCASQCDGEDRC